MLVLFDLLRIEDEIRDWFLEVLRARAQEEQRSSRQQVDESTRQLSITRQQQERLLNLRLLEEIDTETFARKATELRDREAKLKLQIEAPDRGRYENADIAVKAFELSQQLREKWLTADYAAKRQILEIVCLNLTLDDTTLIPTMRKPFDALAEGLISADSRGERI